MGSIGTWRGIEIVTDLNMVDRFEDWSDVRSPSRAERRRRRGFQQRIKIVTKPSRKVITIGNRAIMHPAMYEEFRRQTEAPHE